MNRSVILRLLVCSLLVISRPGFAQKLYDQLADEMCACMTEKHRSADATVDLLELMGEQCVTFVLQQHAAKIEKKVGANWGNMEEPEGLEAFLIDLFKPLFQRCDLIVEVLIRGQMAQERLFQELYERANEARQADRQEEALRDYSQALRLNGGSAEAHNYRGTIHYKQGNLYGSIRDFVAAAELDTTNGTYRNNLATIAYELGDYRQAHAFVDQALSRAEVDSCRALNLKGLIYSKQGEMDSSQQCFEQAFACDPTDSLVAYNLGYIHYQKENWEEARNWFRASDSLGHDDGDLQSYLGNTYHRLSQYEQAIEHHRRHLAFDSLSNPIPYFNLGICYYDMQEYPRAKAFFQQAQLIDNLDEDILYYLALTSKEQGELPEAKGWISQAISESPTSAGYYDLRAAVHGELGEYEEAILDYRLSLELYPDDCQVYEYLLELYEKVDRPDKAKATVKKMRELNCEKP